MQMSADYYEILGVERDASQDDIKRAFRSLARKYHPDATGNEPEAAERYKQISEAYSVLSDPSRRRDYDLQRTSIFGGGSPFSSTIEDIFDSFFSGVTGTRRQPRERSRVRRGDAVEIETDLELREAVFGVSRTVTFRRFESCQECGGNGCEPGSQPVRCNRCNGSGQVEEIRRSVFGNVVTAYPCAACAQTGQVILTPCKACGGLGRVPGEAHVDVDIPGGVETGDRLRVSGHGEAGYAGGPPGDLYVRFVVLPDERFRRAGDDLETWVEVPMTTAALGGDVVFESLDGTERLTMPKGTQSGELFRVRSRGAPRRSGRGRGDLHVRVHVLTPTDLDGEQERLVKRLAELRDERGEGGGILGRLRRALGFDEE